MSPGRTHGFTLTELMVALAVVAILASIALPSYRGYVWRANRTVAKNTASDIISRQESFKVDRKRYATRLDKLGLAAETLYLDREGNLAASSSSDSIYQLSLQGNPGSSSCPPGGSASLTGYTVVLAPINAQAGDSRCATLCQSSAGLRGASGSADDCWTR